MLWQFHHWLCGVWTVKCPSICCFQKLLQFPDADVFNDVKPARYVSLTRLEISHIYISYQMLGLRVCTIIPSSCPTFGNPAASASQVLGLQV